MTTYHITFTYRSGGEEDARYDHEVELTCTGFAQLVYEGLRLGPNGDCVAYYDYSSGLWKLCGGVEKRIQPGKANAFSDIVIWTEEDK